MTDENIFYNAIAIALQSDYRAMAKLHSQHGSWQATYQSLKTEVIAPDPKAAWDTVLRDSIELVLLSDPSYPAPLREVAQPPLGIYYKGRIKADGLIPFAIVGTRRATPEGKMIARQFASKLAKSGFAIVSGLAFGIDCAAHVGCLDANGATIAVLANGLDSIYPATNAPLAEKILTMGGTILSEYPPGSPPLPYRFLERNRIVSGLSKGILVIESPAKSGSLATARFALEQNRDVFVTPGPITHPNFFGSHTLIRQGAELATKPEDILEAYGMMKTVATTDDDDVASPEEKLVLQALRASEAPQDVDKIISTTKLEPRIANQTLTFLVLKNIIKETEAGYTMNL